MTQKSNTKQQEGLYENTDTFSPVTTTTSELNIVDLFGIGASEELEEKRIMKPFVHQVRLHGPQGEIVQIWANIDDGAMKEVMSLSMFRKVKHRLGAVAPLSQLLRVANGTIIRLEAKWNGKVEVNGISTDVTFEVFDSGGKWGFLFRKTLLEKFKAKHDYETDTITLQGVGGETVIHNQAHITMHTQPQQKPAAQSA